MKIEGARNEPFAAIRRPAPTQAGAAAPAVAAPPVAAPLVASRADTVQILGVPQTEMTPAVQAAIQTLLAELDELRGEVGRLRQRLAQAEDAADRDPLTGLLNRRGFLRELSRVRAFAQRYGTPASLLYVDLDGFKEINDRHGHAAGDAALKAVADRLAAHVRESDLVGRLGGDEFAVVLVQADQATAEGKAAALRQEIEDQPLRFGDWLAPIRLSCGVREITEAESPDDLLAGADRAMYAAKRLRKSA
ncbi:MAG: GGDEF domain-containing protein [Caulobacterales bacterium]|nr:GGDEF domain-containing protein [Caulobacterales bacterium]